MSYYDDDDRPRKPRKPCACCGARSWRWCPPSGTEYAGYECGECGEFVRMDDSEYMTCGGDDGPSDADPGL